jgi:hypothetical protein
MNQQEKNAYLSHPRVYLWARCEGWVRIGMCRAVIVNDECGEVCDERGAVLLRRHHDGMWIEPKREPRAMHFDQIAVTHQPMDSWQLKRSEQEKKDQELGAKQENSKQSLKGNLDATCDLFSDSDQNSHQ